jgi:hypothetical protein
MLASAGGEDDLGNAVCTVGRGFQLDLWMAGENGLYFGG